MRSFNWESFLLKSGLSRQLFNAFLSDYQSYPEQSLQSDKPFVYVNGEGVVKVVTDLIEDELNQLEEHFAVSIGQDGWMEMLEP